MKDRELVKVLGEAIRKVLINEHYPNCDCSQKLKNSCNKRRLEAAFQVYAKENPNYDNF